MKTTKAMRKFWKLFREKAASFRVKCSGQIRAPRDLCPIEQCAGIKNLTEAYARLCLGRIDVMRIINAADDAAPRTPEQKRVRTKMLRIMREAKVKS